MFRTSLSIRHKAIIAAIASYLFMAATVAGSYYFIHQLESKISYLEDLNKLEEAVLEARRFEKNYFLYGDSIFLSSAGYNMERANSLLNKNYERISDLSSPREAAGFRKGVEIYRELLAKCAPNKGLGDSCEQQLRATGSQLLGFANRVAGRKRESVKQTMNTAGQLLLLGLGVVGIGLVGPGLFLVLKVVKPLKLLEESTYKVAQGEFQPIEKLPPEKEIRDVFDSFNKMARRLQTREEQLVRSKKLAALGTMLAGVAHEVNNPLSNISSSCEILLEELEDGDREFQRSLLTEVLEQVDKARSIILNLLEFSRSKELTTEPVKVREIIERSLSLVQGQISPEIKVDLHVDENLLIQANRQRMEQVFVNLLSNAAHAIEGEGEVRVWAMPAQNGMVSIRVIDSGKGIPEEDLPKIFDPFFSTKDVGHGTGLGLFITHDIVVRHGGSISVKSVEGQGTSFCMLIPAA